MDRIQEMLRERRRQGGRRPELQFRYELREGEEEDEERGISARI
jgi:hypothetical protein